MIQIADEAGALAVATNLRDEEIIVKMLGREAAAKECLRIVTGSHWRWKLTVSGRSIALFGGHAEPGDKECSVWLFCAKGVEAHPLELFKGIKQCIDWGKKHWPVLYIAAEPRSPRQMRFLEMLGFSERKRFARGDVIYKELST